ncbi:cellulase family glycosylhydrolase [Pseudomonas syringae pv. tagetis]|uniref:Cellulase family glycosylhydrolase n=1 Tax=Pseudomonas syringae pv. tagetis TaxID=129140 RepID=A0A0Q0C244_9PSED|nr:cellulase family glycosylhydrolase [Pseudomonas syringae group genomosp. 7]KPY85362.1 Type III effector HopAH2 [Pseudomonas syringae pv. tagetis]RMW10554.1 Type III effector HopAH2 [Pseudomonas syringae pv. tagetis]RMW19961.1 Type III effector HopAH2 [Pseudomonas syringae pv. tagetis]UNB66724.1 cellulase family glycosylhydrolase [Pseudomonas syringae pv. tagetis]
MNIRSDRSYDPPMAAREKPAMADRTTLAVSTGTTDASPAIQAKLDTYTATDSRSAEAPEVFPVYTRAMLNRNARSLENEASSSDTALLVSQKTRVSQDDTKALREELAAVKNTTAASEPEKEVKEKDKVASSEPVKNTEPVLRGGANVNPDDIATPAAAKKMIQDLKAIGGGTLRFQMTHDQIKDVRQLDKLRTLLDEGGKQGVKVQFTFRDNANQGGGNVLTGEKLKEASTDISNVVKKFGSRSGFVLDTFNQGGKSASQDWADMQITLIKSARNAGYKGSIVVEDSNWGGGLTAGAQSGLVKFADQLKAANGEGNPALIGSFHVYARESEASSRLTKQIKALQEAGYKFQIGEVGNANLLIGNTFQQKDAATKALQDNMPALKAAGVDILPGKNQFQDGKLSRHAGFAKSDQFG